MSLLCNSILRFLRTGLPILASAVLLACFDIPDTPDSTGKITSVEISISQFDENMTELLKVNSSDTATLVATVSSNAYSDKIQYYWYSEELLDSGRTYTITPAMMTSASSIPNRLVVKDTEGNSLESTFHIIINAPPRFSQQTAPADGDTLYGNSQTPFTFSWSALDNDVNDKLEYFIEIDSVTYNVGELTQIAQSGFAEGIHTYKISVQDSYGDQDSLPARSFYVIDTLNHVADTLEAE